MKKVKKEFYSYADLCEIFKEDKQTSSLRTAQFKRWRKEYDIEKVTGKNLYTVKRKTVFSELPVSLKNKEIKSKERVPSNYKFLEPMFMYMILQSKNKKITTSYFELQEKMGLVNNNFIKVKNNPESCQALADSIGVTIDELNSFNNETYVINYISLKSVIDRMSKLGLLYKQDVFIIEQRTENGDVVIKEITGNEYSRIIDLRNNISREIYDKKYNSKIIYEKLSREEQEIVKTELNKRLGYVRHKQRFNIYADTVSISYQIDENFNYLMNKQLSNENNQLRIAKSQRGDLKYMKPTEKYGMIDGVISIQNCD